MKLTSTPARIVLVEDDAELARSTHRLLASLGDVIVETCHDVATARLALQSSFDVLVSDFHLPDGTGVDVLSAAADADGSAPRILVTAHAEWDTATSCINVGGAFRVLAKPLSADMLAATVEDALATKRIRDVEAEERSLIEQNAHALAAANADLVVDRLGVGRTATCEREQMVRVIARAIDRRLGNGPAAEMLATVGRAFAERLGLSGDELNDVETAILLHRVGLIAMRDGESMESMPDIGAEILHNAGFSAGVTHGVADSNERFDGEGVHGRSALQISLPARILAIVSRYLELTRGDFTAHNIACAAMLSDERLDPQLVAAFIIQPPRSWSATATMPYAPAFARVHS
jgi:response regulator RpfG family c-di-GMP phosphodiesterase